MQATATIHTANARRYLSQFCKHFVNKLPVELDPALASGKVPFSAGECALYADDQALELQLSVETTDNMTILQDIVSRHLVRFAFREDIALDWKIPA